MPQTLAFPLEICTTGCDPPGTHVKWDENRKGGGQEQEEEAAHTPEEDLLLLQASVELPGSLWEKGNRFLCQRRPQAAGWWEARLGWR